MLIKLLLLSVIFIAPFFGAQASILKHIPDAKLVGKGSTDFFFWTLYDAKLYAPKGQWQENQPFALSLTYDIEASGEEIAATSIDEIKRMGFNNQAILETWYDEMVRVFPNVKPGDTITGINLKNNVVFTFNGKPIGTIHDQEFADNFFAIWLGEETRKPDLREKLLGDEE